MRFDGTLRQNQRGVCLMNTLNTIQLKQSMLQTGVCNKTLLIKVGGSILHEEQKIISLCKDIKTIKEAGFQIILVHGGSKAINETLTLHGIQSKFVDGLRVTSAAAVKIIEMVLCGHVNLSIVKKLNRIGVSAIGLSGADQQMLLCDYYSKTHGFVGEIKAINTAIIHHLLSFKNTGSSSIPVISTIGVDKEGNALNINADMAACYIANALHVDQLIYLTDQDGIYDSNGELFSQLSEENLQALIDQSIVSGGMLIKAKAVLASLRAGLNQILILNGNQKNVLIDVLFNEKNLGTLCEKQINQTNHFNLDLNNSYLGADHDTCY
jgi:acetylglutamate kinase